MIAHRIGCMTHLDIRSHLEPLRRYARVLMRADQGADDLVQGALLRAYERRASFREGADLRVWLMAILHNHFIDQLRARKSTVAREQAWADASPRYTPPDGEHVVRLEQLRHAFLALPTDQREALHLVAVEGLSVAEAAGVLEIPAGTVMSRVGRARAALRRFEDGPQNKQNPAPLKIVRGRDVT